MANLDFEAGGQGSALDRLGGVKRDGDDSAVVLHQGPVYRRGGVILEDAVLDQLAVQTASKEWLISSIIRP
jgi:hypothetical protein